MFTQTLQPDTLRALQLAGSIKELSQSYLAGGTGLALHLGHRISVDLDFFTDVKFDETQMKNQLNRLEGFNLDSSSWQTVMGKLGKTTFSLFYYQYPLIEKAVVCEGVNVAAKEDIAAMKIEAIRGRGTRKDYIDLFFLAKEYSWEKMFEYYDKKYGVIKDKLYEIIRTLGYLEDAEQNTAMPEMLTEVTWEEIKGFFVRESNLLGSKYIL